MGIIVTGMVHRHQTATTEKTCAACRRKIKVGTPYLRVKWEQGKKGIECFHGPCFKDEFTDEVR
jgi:hypothetical protein